jgi:hypothetical protein
MIPTPTSVALQARRPLGAYRIPPETGLLIPSEKRGLSVTAILGFPHFEKTYRDLAQM